MATADPDRLGSFTARTGVGTTTTAADGNALADSPVVHGEDGTGPQASPSDEEKIEEQPSPITASSVAAGDIGAAATDSDVDTDSNTDTGPGSGSGTNASCTRRVTPCWGLYFFPMSMNPEWQSQSHPVAWARYMRFVSVGVGGTGGGCCSVRRVGDNM